LDQDKDKKGIIITGANGFIGSYLVNYFLERNFLVTAFVRKKPATTDARINYQLFDLKDTIPEIAFPGSDYLIHCAYIKTEDNPDARIINNEGTKKLLDLSRKYNLKKFVFISSFSAHNQAVSEYGKSKYESEKIFDSERDLVLKPGLVIGNGGLFMNITSHLKKNRIIPVINGGRQLIQTLFIGDLAEVIETGITRDVSGVYPVAELHPVTMSEMYRLICRKERKNPVLISVPFFFAWFGISVFNYLRLKTPVSKENLLGLKGSITYDVTKSVEVFNMNFSPLAETIKMI
jgi:nucleoside-diphosphate-sugar epimerase